MNETAIVICGWGACSLVTAVALMWIDATMPPKECLTFGEAARDIVVAIIAGPLYILGFLVFGLCAVGVWASKRNFWDAVIIRPKHFLVKRDVEVLPSPNRPTEYTAYRWMEDRPAIVRVEERKDLSRLP
jgi:hypothetical protein